MLRLKEYNKERQKSLITDRYRRMNKKKMNVNPMQIVPKIKIKSNQSKKDFRIYHLNKRTDCTLNY